MPEQYKNNRAQFPSGQQRQWIATVRTAISMSKMAACCQCSERTIRDWQREKFAMNAESLYLLSQAAQIPIPTTITLIPNYSHCKVAGKAGAQALLKKYGRIPVDADYRKEKWREWWEREGKDQKNSILSPQPIDKPRRSAALAEFCGIIMGDGGISSNQVTVTLHRYDDSEYVEYVRSLIEKLFGVTPALYPDKEDASIGIVVSRVALVEFCMQLGLVQGNKIKKQIDIPAWIQKDPKFQIACVRGLVDTDGSVFTHRYKVKDTLYQYKKLSFCSKSIPLLKSVRDILNTHTIKSRLTTSFEVRLDSQESVRRYLKIIGSHNPKHLKRYAN